MNTKKHQKANYERFVVSLRDCLAKNKTIEWTNLVSQCNIPHVVGLSKKYALSLDWAHKSNNEIMSEMIDAATRGLSEGNNSRKDKPEQIYTPLPIIETKCDTLKHRASVKDNVDIFENGQLISCKVIDVSATLIDNDWQVSYIVESQSGKQFVRNDCDIFTSVEDRREWYNEKVESWNAKLIAKKAELISQLGL